MTISGENPYHNRWSPTRRWQEVMVRHGLTPQAAEINEIQSIQHHRHQEVADVLFGGDGALIQDGDIYIVRDGENSFATLNAGKVYADGNIHVVPRLERLIFDEGDVNDVVIGVIVTETVVTHEDDASLLSPIIPDSIYSEQPGAARRVTAAEWGTGVSSDPAVAATQKFFSVYIIRQGHLLRNIRPPEIRGIQQTLATRDYEVNGSYLVSGFNLTASVVSGTSPLDAEYTYYVSSGLARVEGFRLERLVSTRLVRAADPFLQGVSAERHTLGAAVDGAFSITLRQQPVARIARVEIQRFTVEFDIPESGVVDFSALPSQAQLSPVRLEFPAQLASSTWSPGDLVVSWSSQPIAPVTVRLLYTELVDVDGSDISGLSTITITELQGLEQGNIVEIGYEYALPRWDYLVVNRDLEFSWLTGVSSINGPLRPVNRLPLGVLLLAEVYYTWAPLELPRVEQLSLGATSQPLIAEMRRAISEIGQDLLQEKLLRQLTAEEHRQKFGEFVEPFLDYSNALSTTTALITSGEMVMSHHLNLIEIDFGSVRSLPFTLEVVLEQVQVTGGIKINEWQNFDVIPPLLTLTPSVDVWSRSRDVQQVVEQERVVNQPVEQELEVTRDLIRRSTRPAEFARARRVDITIDGFRPGETMQAVTVGGVAVTANLVTANSSGQLTSWLNIPAAQIPSGQVLVRVEGDMLSVAESLYSSQGQVITRQWIETRTTVRRRIDPLAQTFLLTAARQVTAIGLQIWTVGDNQNTIQVQIRTVRDGLPTAEILGEAVLAGSAQWRRGFEATATFGVPVFLEGNQEYAIVVLTNDANHEIAVARLGDITGTGSDRRIVTQQPYTVGVLLTSSNASTWTALQDADLWFKIYAARFTPNYSIATATDQTFTWENGFAQVGTQFQAPVFLPPGTDVTFSWLNENYTNAVPRNHATALATTSGAVTANLSGTTTLSPILFGGTVGIGLGWGPRQNLNNSRTSGFVQYFASFLTRPNRLATLIIVTLEIFVTQLSSDSGVYVAITGNPDPDNDPSSNLWRTGLVDAPTTAGRWEALTFQATMSSTNAANTARIGLEVRLYSGIDIRPRLRHLRAVRVVA